MGTWHANESGPQAVLPFAQSTGECLVDTLPTASWFTSCKRDHVGVFFQRTKTSQEKEGKNILIVTCMMKEGSGVG